MQEVYTPDEVAEILKVTPKVVRAWLRDGKLPGLRLGRLWRIRESDLESFIGGSGFGEAAGAAKRRKGGRSTKPTKKTPQSGRMASRTRNKR